MSVESERLNRVRKILRESKHFLRPNRVGFPQHLLEAQQYSLGLLTELFYIVKELRKGPLPLLKNKLIYWYSDEPSTRTRSSVSAGARYVGADTEEIISTDSSAKKGEPLEDTIRAFVANGASLIAIRTHDVQSIYRAALASDVPLMNCGTGTGEHPTQAGTDALTIFEKLGRLDEFSIAFIGDLALSRVVHSKLYLLSKFLKVKAFGVSPDHLRIDGGLRYYLHDKGFDYTETSDLDWVLPQVDVVYQTRAQKERSSDKDFHLGLSNYIIDRKAVMKMKKGAGVMHPLPRNEELAKEVDDMPQNWYHFQMECGMFMRAALLAKMLG